MLNWSIWYFSGLKTFQQIQFIFISISEQYMNNMQCDFTIHVSQGSSITLQLIDINMEISQGCTYDYVAVRKSVLITNTKQIYSFFWVYFAIFSSSSDSWWTNSSSKPNWKVLPFRTNYSTRIHIEYGVCSICFRYQYKRTWFRIEIFNK